MKREDIEKAAKDYSIGKTYFRRNVLKEVDADNYVLRKGNCSEDFIAGAEWQTKQLPWVSVKERLPDENEDIIILCKHGAIFNGTYSNNVWFCMDGYIYDTYKGNPIYSSMSSIPPSWEPIAWMPKPKFEE